MENFNRKAHWENIYSTKELKDVSWYQPKPQTSLNFISELNVLKSAKLIDIGGGDSFLVDHLLELGYQNISVLDVSAAAIERAKKRLGSDAKKVNWIVADVTEFEPKEKYDLWHDRAAFHFLTEENDISRYIKTLEQALTESGLAVVGTFSEEGPKKCSGIEIKQYSDDTLTKQFATVFDKIKCLSVDHPTPFDTVQNFVFCSFRKK